MFVAAYAGYGYVLPPPLKILMVGATPTEPSISNRRPILLDSRYFDTWFLDNFISEPVPQNCFKGNFNDSEFMAKVVDKNQGTFDYVVVDYSVSKFMKIHVLKSLLKLLKPGGSLFIQGIGGLKGLPDQPCETKEEFEKKCKEYFEEYFSNKNNLLYTFPTFYMPPLPKSFMIDFTVKFAPQKKLIEEWYRLAFKKYCEDQLKSSYSTYTSYKDLPIKCDIKPTLHFKFVTSEYRGAPKVFVDYLYKITPDEEKVAQEPEAISSEKPVIQKPEEQVTQETKTEEQVINAPGTIATEKMLETPEEEIIIQKVMNESKELLDDIYGIEGAEPLRSDFFKALDYTNKIEDIEKNEFIDFKALVYQKANEAWVLARSNCINFIKDKDFAKDSSFKKLIVLADQIIPVLANREKSLNAEYKQKAAAYYKEIKEKGALSRERSNKQTETRRALSIEEFRNMDWVINKLHIAARNHEPLLVSIPADSSLHIKLKGLSDGLWCAGITRGDLLALDVDTLREIIKAYG